MVTQEKPIGIEADMLPYNFDHDEQSIRARQGRGPDVEWGSGVFAFVFVLWGQMSN